MSRLKSLTHHRLLHQFFLILQLDKMAACRSCGEELQHQLKADMTISPIVLAHRLTK